MRKFNAEIAWTACFSLKQSCRLTEGYKGGNADETPILLKLDTMEAMIELLTLIVHNYMAHGVCTFSQFDAIKKISRS